MFLGSDTVDVLVAQMTSGYGGVLGPGWSSAVSTPTPAEVRPNRSQEVTSGAAAAVVWSECYLDARVDLSEDRSSVGGRAVRIRWRGTDYDLEGTPAVFTARGVAHHQRVVLKATV